MADTVARLPSAKPPRPPARLRAAGKRLWTDVISTYELRSDELIILGRACRAVDTITAMDDEINRAGLTTAGSRGQMVAHPLVAERRAHELVLARLVRQLHLPESDSDETALSRSWRGRRAARERWTPDGPAQAPVD